MRYVTILLSNNENKDFEIDFHICSNLYYTSDSKKIRNNLKNFDIKIYKGIKDKSLGIRTTKIENNVIVTCDIVSKNGNARTQWLLNDKTNFYDIILIKELEPFHQILLEAIQLTKVDTLKELQEYLGNNNSNIG